MGVDGHEIAPTRGDCEADAVQHPRVEAHLKSAAGEADREVETLDYGVETKTRQCKSKSYRLDRMNIRLLCTSKIREREAISSIL